MTKKEADASLVSDRKINVLQFLPYFPPHIGGLETNAQQRGTWREKKEYGTVTNVIMDIGYFAEDTITNNMLLLPAIELIPNFPFPKLWTSAFRQQFNKLTHLIKKHPDTIVVSRTRFFVSSFLGGVFAKIHKLKRIHIEHGSDYVKVASSVKNSIAWVYDQILGRWVFRNVNKVVAISQTSKRFAQRFTNKTIPVIHRGVEFSLPTSRQTIDLNKKFPGKIVVGFLGRLYKWKNVERLINAYYALDKTTHDKIQMVVIGDGESLEAVKQADNENKVYFTGAVPFDTAIGLQAQFDIHVHSSSMGGALSTVLLQAMYLGCLIVATPYEGADEVIEDGKNGILVEDDSIDELKKGIQKSLEILNTQKETFAHINQEIIEEKFQWNRNIEKYFDLIVN